MKALKLLILSLLFVAGQQAIAQNVNVNNRNATITFTVNVTFARPCLPVTVVAPPLLLSTTPMCMPLAPITNINITFTDNTCLPPAPVVLNFPGPGNYQYVLCNGFILNFIVAPNPNGLDWDIVIPC